MKLRLTHFFLLVLILILPSCAQPTDSNQPTAAPPSPTETSTPTATATPAIPALFGAITQGEIQAYSLEPVANAIFNKVMDRFLTNGNILEYQVMRVTIFPTGDGSLYAEITFNVRTTDLSWLADGGTQVADDWIDDKCSRFDFVTTETEFQLWNKRTCN